MERIIKAAKGPLQRRGAKLAGSKSLSKEGQRKISPKAQGHSVPDIQVLRKAQETTLEATESGMEAELP